MNKRKPFGPGEILKEEFMDPLKLTAKAVGSVAHLSEKTINDIIEGKQPITQDIAARLGDAFDMSYQYWMNLQRNLDNWNKENDGKT